MYVCCYRCRPKPLVYLDYAGVLRICLVQFWWLWYLLTEALSTDCSGTRETNYFVENQDFWVLRSAGKTCQSFCVLFKSLQNNVGPTSCSTIQRVSHEPIITLSSVQKICPQITWSTGPYVRPNFVQNQGFWASYLIKKHLPIVFGFAPFASNHAGPTLYARPQLTTCWTMLNVHFFKDACVL